MTQNNESNGNTTELYYIFICYMISSVRLHPFHGEKCTHKYLFKKMYVHINLYTKNVPLSIKTRYKQNR
jgi:hypothetical protein